MYFSIIYRESFFDLSVKNQFDFLNAEYRTGAMIFICLIGRKIGFYSGQIFAVLKSLIGSAANRNQNALFALPEFLSGWCFFPDKIGGPLKHQFLSLIHI